MFLGMKFNLVELSVIIEDVWGSVFYCFVFSLGLKFSVNIVINWGEKGR